MTLNVLGQSPTRYVINVTGGDLWDWTFPLVDDLGAPADLSGLTVAAEIAVDGAANLPFAASIAGSGVRLTLLPAQTVGLTWREAQFDAVLSNGDGSVRITAVAGTILRQNAITTPPAAP